MKGTLIAYNKNTKASFFKEEKTNSGLLIDIFTNEDVIVKRKLNSKFEDDKVFDENNDLFIALDGIILNAAELKEKHALSSNFQVLEKLYKLRGTKFIDDLKGDFSISLYDKTLNKLFVYTNITSTKPIYYTSTPDSPIFISSNPLLLVNSLKDDNVKLTPNYEVFYVSAAFGYLFGEQNYANEIRKLEPGKFLEVDKTGYSIHTYHHLSPYPMKSITEDQMVDGLEERFRYALDLQYKKDTEYGYSHIATMTGGLDSRMTIMGGHALGYKPDTITFSSKGHWEQIIAQEIAKNLNLKNQYLRIDNGEFLKETDRLFNIDGGVVSHHAAAQMHELYGMANLDKYGLLHTGQFGSVVNGWCLNPLGNKDYHYQIGPIFAIRWDKEYRSKVEPQLLPELLKHDSLEVSQFYTHVFNGTVKGNWLISEYTESVSPYTFQEVLDFCVSLEPASRKNHRLYIKWIEKYHPKAGSYFYDATGRRTIRYSTNRYINKVNHLYNLLIYKTKGLKTRDNEWLNYKHWNNDSQFMKYFDDRFYRGIEKFEDKELAKSLTNQYKTGDFEQKMCAFNLIVVHEKYFD